MSDNILSAVTFPESDGSPPTCKAVPAVQNGSPWSAGVHFRTLSPETQGVRMPAAAYRVWDKSAGAVAVGEGKFGAQYVGIVGIAKPGSPDHPLSVANEIICGDIGRAIRLPIPPGFIIERENQPNHVSLSFTLLGEKPPPADVAAIATNLPEEACATILFDLWVVNNDRHNKNLAYDSTQRRLNLFDHGLALMSTPNGRKRLESVGPAKNTEVLSRHCLTPVLKSADGFKVWSERFNQIPEYFIRETVADAVSLGVTDDDAAYCADFLIKRRSTLMDVIRANKDLFSNVPKDLWDKMKWVA